MSALNFLLVTLFFTILQKYEKVVTDQLLEEFMYLCTRLQPDIKNNMDLILSFNSTTLSFEKSAKSSKKY